MLLAFWGSFYSWGLDFLNGRNIYFLFTKKYREGIFSCFLLSGKFKKMDGFSPQLGGGGGGVQAESTFHVFFTNNVKIMSKNGKIMMKQW